MSDYADFLANKQQGTPNSGFEPLWMPDFLFDFQRHLVEWAAYRACVESNFGEVDGQAR